MRFKDFLVVEESSGRTGVQTSNISMEKAIEWVNGPARRVAEHILDDYNHAIFRGMSISVDRQFQFGDSSTFTRRAANTTNFVNSFVSTSPRWVGWPPRNKSFVCASAKSNARSYGPLYLAIPEDSAEIGVCPTYDFFASFSASELLNYNLRMNVPNINDFMQHLGYYGRHVIDSFNPRPNLMKWTSDDLRKINDEHPHNTLGGTPVDIIEAMKKYDLENLAEYFDLALDPYKNGFQKVVAAQLDTISGAIGHPRSEHDSNPERLNRELWISGKVLFVRANVAAKSPGLSFDSGTEWLQRVFR